VGIDVDPWKVALAEGLDAALHRTDDVVGHTLALSNGRGADAVIVTATSTNHDPLVLAGEIARDRAHVVIVGAVPIDVPRSPYYEKELDVRLSRSYGPGRYDRAYEERGIDYPAGYVRWTENRNMQAFLQAVQAKQVSLDKLVTHRFAIDDAPRAYDLLESTEPYLGVVLHYDADAPVAKSVLVAPRTSRGRANLGLIGAGSFAGGKLLPILKSLHGVAFAKVATASGLSAKDVARRHGFAAAVGSADEILDDDAIDTVVIATRHDSHAELAERALARGKAVLVEKPLATTREQLERVMAVATRNPALAVGFNRRFSPHVDHLRAAFALVPGALAIQIRVNAGAASPDSWAHDDGGRLLGEGCHFIDLAHAIAGAPITRVHAVAIGHPDPDARLRDNAAITLGFANGGIATILYTAKGDAGSGKERVEVFGGGISATIDDFTTTTIVRNGRSERYKTAQDKGHRAELVRFIEMATAGARPPIALAELRLSSVAALAVLESLDTGNAIEL
ncbi:MAG: Gfo/Idh/MocA family oxidoreductase, partial [Kofleriaceae bacterium]